MKRKNHARMSVEESARSMGMTVDAYLKFVKEWNEFEKKMKPQLKTLDWSEFKKGKKK